MSSFTINLQEFTLTALGADNATPYSLTQTVDYTISTDDNNVKTLKFLNTKINYYLSPLNPITVSYVVVGGGGGGDNSSDNGGYGGQGGQVQYGTTIFSSSKRIQVGTGGTGAIKSHQTKHNSTPSDGPPGTAGIGSSISDTSGINIIASGIIASGGGPGNTFNNYSNGENNIITIAGVTYSGDGGRGILQGGSTANNGNGNGGTGNIQNQNDTSTGIYDNNEIINGKTNTGGGGGGGVLNTVK